MVDLPYNLSSIVKDTETICIIESAAEIKHRLVVVYTSDITRVIGNIGFTILDQCSVLMQLRKIAFLQR
jgi:hypothetical protein